MSRTIKISDNLTLKQDDIIEINNAEGKTHILANLDELIWIYNCWPANKIIEQLDIFGEEEVNDFITKIK